MSGEFTYEDLGGKVIISSKPGLESSMKDSSGKTSSKAKTTERAISKRPTIELFMEMYNIETDEVWKDRLYKMGKSKFPNGISWDNTKETKEVYGDLIYKKRQLIRPITLYKSDSIEDLLYIVKEFIMNYTNIDSSTIDEETDFIRVDRSKMDIYPWGKKSPKDQYIDFMAFVKNFSRDNDLTKEESEDLLSKIVVFNFGKKILPYLEFDSRGNIVKIKNLHKSKDGIFKLKY